MSQLSIDELKDELDIEFFLERESLAYRVTRGVSGSQLNIKHCPAADCRDSRWRTYFGTDTGMGNCFVCNRKYNKLTYIREHFEYDWRQTFEVCKEILREQGWRPKREAVAAVDHGDVELPMSIALPTEDGENLAYLEQRGFGVDIARYFQLRYCEFGWWKFKDAEGQMQTQSFANRVIIPVYDLDGKLVTFQGRDLKPPISAEQKALGVPERQKYLFPKELPGTGRYLLNGQNVMATKEVAMGEGAFDVAAMKIALDGDQALRHVVPIGSFGKHLSYGNAHGDDQLGRFIQLKARGVTTVTIMWDGEPKALEAALNAGKLLHGLGLIARIALLPFEKDPNEVAPEIVRAAYYAAQVWSPSLDVKWRLRNPYSERERSRQNVSQR